MKMKLSFICAAMAASLFIVSCSNFLLGARKGNATDGSIRLSLSGVVASGARTIVPSGGDLPARFVIHTVGPIHSEKAESRKQKAELRDCYINSLKLAAEKGLKTIAFPSISTGAYRYPLAEAAPIALKAVKDFLSENSSIKEVRFVLFNNEIYEAYVNAAGV